MSQLERTTLDTLGGLVLIVGSFLALFAGSLACAQDDQVPEGPRRIDGYRGIWFDLGQRSEFGSKYSGGLGTYTAKHHPLAVHAPKVGKTFFVYGGTTAGNEKHLLAMAAYYDHRTKTVPKPVVVHDKQGIDDPHDNPSLQIDQEGRLWVFVSGRGRKRPGHLYQSRLPHDIASFDYLGKREFTYPQPWWIKDQGFLFLFTKYTRGRELYWSTSDAGGKTWGPDQKLATMGGHYQMSNHHEGRVITAFNRHPGGKVDLRTNLYFLQTKDRGQTWQTVTGETVKTPLTDPQGPGLVRDYRKEGRLVYLKDLGFDAKGHPVLLYLTSGNHRPGPAGAPRIWTVAHWSGERWVFHEVTRSTHNYDMGSLYLESDGTWRIIGPTEAGPQEHGAGGEVAMWISRDQGKTWRMTRQLTRRSKRNHGYVRRPVNAQPDFYGFWADGNPDQLSESRLSFTNREGGAVWQLPYEMKEGQAKPEVVAAMTLDPEKKRMAETILRHQRANGGWPKNYDRSGREIDDAATAGQEKKDTTIDNGATHTEVKLLAGFYRESGDERYREACLRGLKFLLRAQYDHGGWPQYFPDAKGYHRHITYNDGAMIGVMTLLREISPGAGPYSFVPPDLRRRCAAAVEKGIACLLKCQIVVDGKKTGWCAQHDEKTFVPRKARSYELPSISGYESVGVVRFLMGIERPSPEVVAAVEGAVAWFDEAKLSGIKVVRREDPSLPRGWDKVVVRDEAAPPMWARFYAIETKKPIFCSRDGVAREELREISYERRTGYSWLGRYADGLFREYEVWRANKK